MVRKYLPFFLQTCILELTCTDPKRSRILFHRSFYLRTSIKQSLSDGTYLFILEHRNTIFVFVFAKKEKTIRETRLFPHNAIGYK